MINNNLNSIENNVVVYVPFYTSQFYFINWYQTLLDYKNSNNSNINYLF